MSLWSSLLLVLALGSPALAARLAGQARQSLNRSAPPRRATLSPPTCVEAILVETRASRSIAVALRSAADLKDGQSGDAIQILTVAHGRRNEAFVKQLVDSSPTLHRAELDGRLRFLKLDVDDLGGDFGKDSYPITEDLQVEYHDRYSRLLFRKDFWERMKCDHVLVMQSDTILCPNSPEHLSEFVGYDFIGGNTPQMNNFVNGKRMPMMNGGLSLRSRPAMLKCLSREDMHPFGGEDSWFNSCPDVVNRPSVQVMDRFAIDNAHKPARTVPFGLHKPWGSGSFKQQNMKSCSGALDLQEADR